MALSVKQDFCFTSRIACSIYYEREGNTSVSYYQIPGNYNNNHIQPDIEATSSLSRSTDKELGTKLNIHKMSPIVAKSREKARLGRAAPVATDQSTSLTPKKSKIVVDGVSHDLIEIQATGDVILEVIFENTSACNRSIPAESIKELRSKKLEIPSAKVMYRVDLETLKKSSKYFANLLGSEVFGEGQAVKDTFSRLKLEDLRPSEVEAEKLPRVTMVNDEFGTRTLGREAVFLDLLRVLHGNEHTTRPVNLLYLVVLVGFFLNSKMGRLYSFHIYTSTYYNFR